MDPGQPPNPNNVWNGRDDASFEDSERFEEDSTVSDDAADESQQNWRGWADLQTNCSAIQPGLSCVVYQYYNANNCLPSTAPIGAAADPTQHPMMLRGDNPTGTLLTLSEFSARVCAEKWSFQQLEQLYAGIIESRPPDLTKPPPPKTIPEKIFLSFIVHCFPQSTDEIRMYSTLANGSNEQYEFGKLLYEWGNVRDVSQTGFLLSGNIKNTRSENRHDKLRDEDSVYVTVKVDRCRIVECTCECSNRQTSRPSWCKHVVALCLYRIFERSRITFKETIADAINSMSDSELRRLVQWHINEIPRKCIPGFQMLIDQIKDKTSEINKLNGAPDPTDGGHEPVSRYDFPEIENKVRRLLCRFCIPTPTVHCDVSFLANSPDPTYVEWATIMKPLRFREPEGIWNLLQMVREMFSRNDENAVALLRTVTDECLANNQVLLWWYISKLVQSGDWKTTSFKVTAPQELLLQLNCAHLCDEVVTLWKLVAMNPRAGNDYRTQLAGYLQSYHRTAVNRLKNMINLAPPMANEVNPQADATVLSNHQTSAILQTVINIDVRYPLSGQNMKFNLTSFPGFHPALQMCNYLNEQNVRFGRSSDAIFYVSAPNLQNSYKLVPPFKEKTLKKKKKKKKLSKRREEEGEPSSSGRRENEYQGIDGIWRAVPDMPIANQAINDSTESGQESDIQKAPQRLEMAKKRKGDSVEMDVNEVLAASFAPLDTLEARFLRVEAYGTHGYRADAIECALRTVDYLIDSLTEQSSSFCSSEKPENAPSTSKVSTSSSSSSTTSDDGNAADRESEVAKCNRFLSTMEKILFIARVLQGREHLQTTVFDIALRSASVTKFPFFTKHQQIRFSYYEVEFVSILDQLWQSVPMGEQQVEKIRAKAQSVIETNSGNNGELPPIALTKFLFLALYWTEASAQNARPGPGNNAPVTPSQALQENRRLLISTDADLALHCALHTLGCRPLISEKYMIHWETVRREKSELACLLLTRYKDSQEKCALVIDKLLDPKLHRIYPHHLSNASFLLSHLEPRRFKPGQRPVFPYEEDAEDDQEEKEDPVGQYEAQLEAHLKELEKHAELERQKVCSFHDRRTSEEDLQSSSQSENDYPPGPSTNQSEPYVDPVPAEMPGLTRENKETVDNLKKEGSIKDKNKKSKKRGGNSFFDPRNFVTDAHVWHMFELAKKIVNEAGGQQNLVMWGNPVVGGTNRRLHLCAIIVGIYALGMSNRISPSWNTRTYSLIGSWVQSQVQEVGAPGIELIREIWMAHFTPNEIAVIADRTSPSTEAATRLEAARLALSVLPFAHALTDDEVSSAMNKCRAESREMLVSGLLAMDTPQFRQIGRAKTLFAAMQHWYELSYENERNPQPPPPPPPGMVANPYANVRLAQRINPQQAVWPNPQQAQGQPAQNNPAAPIQAVLPNPISRTSYLYPQAYRNDYNIRMHQSRSAPQLGGSQEHMGATLQVANHLNMPPPSPTNSLLNAFYYGMRAMDCMAVSPGEDKHLFLKYGERPPYVDDLKVMYNIAKQLNGHYIMQFYANACRSIISPYLLHQYAAESISIFPHRPYHPAQQQAVRASLGPVPLMAQNLVPMLAQAPVNIRYPNLKFSLPGQITNIFISNGYHQMTGELFERCCEQYLQAIVNKMNSPRGGSDFTEVCSFIQSAHEAFKWIPNMGYQLFEEFVRVFKRQKAFKKDCANSVNMLLNQLCQ